MAEISLREYYGQVEDMIDQGRYSQAVAHGKHVLEKYPKCVSGYRLLGRAMLEAHRDGEALDMFLRVLSADPEDMLSWVALSEIYDRRDELEASVWCLERAFELSVDNQLVGEELRQLYARRDGVEPERVELTRGALARLYLKGDLLSRSVSEFRALLDEQPDRVELGVAFAEALWRNEQRLESSEVCQRILDKLPYCLKANLLLGEIWVSSGREEGQMYLRRAEALDPQNVMAQALFGDMSPLLAQDVRITPFEYRPVTEEERPTWMAEVEAASVEGPPLTDGEAALVDIAAALEAQIEIPSWLEEIDVGEAAEAPEVPEFMVSAEEPAEVEESAFAPEEATPEWLTGVGEGLEFAEGMEQESVAELVVEEEDMVGEQVPDWLAGLGTESIDGEEGTPGEEGQVPDFLSEIGAGVFAEESAPSEEEVPDWLTGLREQAAEDVQGPPPVQPAPAEIPDWMQALAPSEGEEPALSAGKMPMVEESTLSADEPILGEVEGVALGGEELVPGSAEEPALSAVEEPALPVEEPVPGPAEEVSPPWLEGEGMPSGEEALAWLEQLTSGKEEELQAQVEAEIEARTAEIMGRPKAEAPVAEAPVVEEPVVQEPAPVAEVPSEPAPAEIPDWVQELAPSGVEELAPPEAAAPVEEPAPGVAEEPVPSGAEEAFGWTAFGEPEVSADVLPKAEEPVPGMVEEAALVLEEAIPEVSPPPALAVEEPVPSEVEGAFGWTAFGAPEAEEPVPGMVEEAAPVLEEAIPEVSPPPALAVEEPVSSEVEGAFGWTAFGAPEAEEPVPGMVEETAPVLEAAQPEVPPPPVLAVEEPVPSVAEEPVPSEVERAFGWTAFGAPEGAAPETVAAISEAAPIPSVAEPALGEGPPPSVVEAVMAEAVAAPLVEEMVPDEVGQVVAPSTEEMEAPLVAEIPVEAAPIPVAPPPAAAAPPRPRPPRPAVAESADPFAAEKAYLKENPRDYDARLNLARALWQTGRRREALEAYSRLVRAGKGLDVVITELEEYLEKWPDVSTQRVLGDAYMKSNQLDKALSLYRQALENL
jgi:tetratricopeptide (TPR) repeat protein